MKRLPPAVQEILLGDLGNLDQESRMVCQPNYPEPHTLVLTYDADPVPAAHGAY